MARDFYEDLFTIGRSKRLYDRIKRRASVLNLQNTRVGVKARRGDGSFGELVPSAESSNEDGYAVGRGPIATIEIGVEVKILFKAMIKQIDRVINDLRKQAEHFRSKHGHPICVAVVGVNYADHCTSYEGVRSYVTDGKRYKHPIQEAADAESRLLRLAAPEFDEFLALDFEANNEPPFAFSWRDLNQTRLKYGAILARVSNRYENGT